MIGDILQPTHLLFVLVVALLVLGPKRLPEAGRALGKGIRDFRSAIGGDEDHHGGLSTEASPMAAPPQAPPMPPPQPPAASVGIAGETPTDATTEQPAETAHPVA
jgi:sec-independent protein translocase protein TatA